MGVGREPVVEVIEKGTIRRSRYPISVDVDRATGLEGPSGTFAKTVTAQAGRGSLASTIVTWSRVAPLEASPSNLSFGLLKRTGDRASRRITLRSRDDRPFRILSVVGGAEDVVVDPASNDPSGPAPTHAVELAYRRSPTSRRFATGQAVIRTDHPEMPSLRVSWSAIAP